MTRPIVRVQHHPSRAELLPRLVEGLGSLPVEVIADPEPHALPSPLRCYLECARLPADGHTHVIVVQDDTVCCPGFPRAATAALDARPDALVALFMPGTPPASANRARAAHAAGERWVQLRQQWMPVVALSWPAPMLADFHEWAAGEDLHGRRSDDWLVGRYVKRRDVAVWATVPSLVEHPDDQPSTIRDGYWSGRNRSRVAAIFTGADMSSVSW